MQPMVSACTTTARSWVLDSPGSSAVSAPRRVNRNGTPSSARVSPISCITASVRPDGLGVCSSPSRVSTIHARVASGITAALDKTSPYTLSAGDLAPLNLALIDRIGLPGPGGGSGTGKE